MVAVTAMAVAGMVAVAAMVAVMVAAAMIIVDVVDVGPGDRLFDRRRR
jgi:hypothetical protein